MASRRMNGRGSVSKRKDGRYGVSLWMTLPDGTRKRKHFTVSTRQAADDLLHERIEQVRRNIPVAVRSWKVGDYLDHWLENVVRAKDRPRTVELYEIYIRIHLKPLLGSKSLTELTVIETQTALNALVERVSIRVAHGAKGVLRAALNRAMREQLISQNVATLAELPPWRRKSITPWTEDEARAFLAAARGHQWELAFQMLLYYGLRKGELLGLRWSDVNLERGEIRVEQQLQAVGGVVSFGPVKTEAGRRLLPIYPALRELLEQHAVAAGRDISKHDEIGDALVFVSSAGTPINPYNFSRTFHLICEKAGIRRITIHHLRHTAATLLKKLGVPARDVQLILGHSHVSTTQQLYQHGDIDGQREAIEKVGRALQPVADSSNGGQKGGQVQKTAGETDGFDWTISGGPGGTRTHDILLKRRAQSTLENLPTSVIERVLALTYEYKLGCVAVKKAVRIKQPSTPLIPNWHRTLMRRATS